MRSSIRMAALAGREMAAKRGFVSIRSTLKCTGVSGSKALCVSSRMTSIIRRASAISMVV
jgi:hypothetical protein